MKVLDLFSGIGGFSLGLERAGMQTMAFCENNPYCRRVLAKHWPSVPIFGDIRGLNTDAVGPIDLICGGFPCQPFSVAGKRRGAADDRHLWPEMYRLVDEIRPTWVIGENVPGLINMGLDQVLSDLENSGYSCRTFAVPAVAVDAPHRRERLWIVGHANRPASERDTRGLSAAQTKERGARQQDGNLPDRPEYAGEGSGERPVANAARVQPRRKEQRAERQRVGQGSQPDHVADARCGHGEGARRGERSSQTPARWLLEPDVGRVADGVPKRVDRLRALGNAVVPQVVEQIGRAIMLVGTE